MRFLLLSLILFSVKFASALDDVRFVETKAKSGDGIYRLLYRYHLDISCDLDIFLKLNKLKADSRILRGKKYKLPIYQYRYNDKSIRSTIGKNDMALAKRIASYNRKLRDKGIKKRYYMQDKVLWVPHHLMYECGRTDTNTTLKSGMSKRSLKTIEVPLFGKRYADVPLLDQSLKGKVFYLISGHGGPDPGAIYQSGSVQMCEDEYAYDVMLRLARNLIQRGAIVEVIIRDPDDGIRDASHLKIDHDEQCYKRGKIPLNQLQRLKQRVSVVNELYRKYQRRGIKDQRLLVIHVDSRPASHRQDVFFLHSKDSKKGPIMAKNLHKVFAQKYKKYRKHGNYDGHVQVRNLYVLSKTLPPAVYVELANIKNKRDRKRITDKANRQALADWLFEGIIK